MQDITVVVIMIAPSTNSCLIVTNDRLLTTWRDSPFIAEQFHLLKLFYVAAIFFKDTKFFYLPLALTLKEHIILSVRSGLGFPLWS